MEKTSLTTALFRLNLLFAISALSYVVCLPLMPYEGSFLHKALPVLILLAYGFYRRSTIGIAIVGALAFSATGDILLALPLENGFVYGLSAFLAGHLCYLIHFHRVYKAHPVGTNTSALALLMLTGIAMMMWILPNTGELQIPVAVYMAVILLMAGAALRLRNLKLAAGALSFVLSDALIAVNKFIFTLPYEGQLIMSTYYLAQVLLLNGIFEVAKRYDPSR